MRKQFIIFLILTFVLGLGYINFSQDANAMRINYCTLDNWGCEDWGSCSPEGIKTRVCSKVTGCIDNDSYTPPAATLPCSISECTEDTWSCDNWGECSIKKEQTRTCTKTFDCGLVDTPSPNTQSCELTKPIITSISPSSRSGIYPDSEIKITGENFNTYGDGTYCSLCNIKVSGISFPSGWNYFWSNTNIIVRLPSDAVSGYITVIDKNGSESNQFNLAVIPYCSVDNWDCGNWGTCSSYGKQTRTCNKISNCDGGPSPATTQSCTYASTCISFYYSNWSECASDGKQTRSITSKHPTNCEGGELPKLTQSCTYAPACLLDTWECGNWGTCSPRGIQTRSCSRTYDCPSAETAAPATSQYCESIYKPDYQVPTQNSNIINQDSIIKSTVKLECPVTKYLKKIGTGTVINSSGLILTNKHVISDTAGCYVGFIDNYGSKPYFNNSQAADIYNVSNDEDIAILKLRNPNDKTLSYIDIIKGNNSNLRLGDKLTLYGYPPAFGDNITFTDGSFSGVEGNYLKTDAIVEEGNSGGGAYLENGNFVGIPSAATKGKINTIGYILSVDKIKSWMNGSSYAYNSGVNNNYSRVAYLLDEIDLNALSSLGLFIAGDEANIKIVTESQTVIAEEKKLITKIDNNLSKRVSGNILLQVEKNGEGWYVNPENKKKYYLGRPADAFSIMRNLGLGIKHSELTGYLNSKFPSRLSGKIVLDVEQNGEAYYINPKDLKGYFLSRPADAFKVMRDLGLGITNNDIRKIDIGEIN
ncbi:MAG: trypsin-like peptidase domain-containing protein [Patescibacteria group bacterium]